MFRYLQIETDWLDSYSYFQIKRVGENEFPNVTFSLIMGK